MTYVIGFGFRMRSGKDSAIEAIIKQRGSNAPEDYKNLHWDIRRYGFGDELKREVTQAALAAGGMEHLFGTWELMQENGNFIEFPEWVRQRYEADPDMSDPLCPLGKQRALLQFWGTEFRRNVNPQYWVNKLAQRIVKEKPEVALIADIRFQNEMDFVKNQSGDVVRVDRPSLGPLPADAHPSESSLAKVPDEEWDRVLVNDGTLEEFQIKALEMFDTFMELQETNQ